MLNNRRYERSLVFGVAACASAALFVLYRSWSYDDPYITFRYAQNLISGWGFVYNAGEKILSTTTPLFALILAVGKLLGADIPTLAVLIGSICIGGSSIIMYELARVWCYPIGARIFLLLLPTFGLLSVTLSSETPIYVALALSVLYTYAIHQYTASGFLAALLILTRPDGVLVPALLVVHFLIWVKGSMPWKGLAVFIIVSLVGWGAIWIYFGSPIPVTLAAKQHQGLMAISQGFAQGLWTTIGWYRGQWFFRIESILAILGLVYMVVKKSPALLLIAWALLYFVSYSALGVTRYFWYYAPLVPGFVFLVAVGLETIYNVLAKIGRSKILSLILVGGSVLGLFFFQARQVYRQSLNPDQRIKLYTAVGEWLRENTPPESKVAALEVGMIGYYSQRYIVDFAGLIQPDVARQMKPDSTYEDTARFAIEQFQPEYVVIYESFVKVLFESNASNCKQVMNFRASDYGSSQDFLVYHCIP